MGAHGQQEIRRFWRLSREGQSRQFKLAGQDLQRPVKRTYDGHFGGDLLQVYRVLTQEGQCVPINLVSALPGQGGRGLHEADHRVPECGPIAVQGRGGV